MVDKNENSKNEKEQESKEIDQHNQQKSDQHLQQKSQQAKSKEEKSQSSDAELGDRLLRLAAEFDNFKKKATEDVKNAKLLGKAELMKHMLSTLDEFDLAIVAMNASEKPMPETAKGLELVFSNFKEILKAEGLTEISTEGKYDPYKHEIIMTKESDKPEGIIIDVVRKGYALHGIMLRPASVIASNGKQEAKEQK